MAKKIGITPAGSLKIARRLHKEEVITPKTMGKATFYTINKDNEYAQNYVQLILQREVKEAHPYVKVWINELRKLKHADIIILFGSVLTKHKQANDIDALLVMSQNNYKTLTKEVEALNEINTKRIHPIYQTPLNVKTSMKNGATAIFDAFKGIVVKGEKKLIGLICK